MDGDFEEGVPHYNVDVFEFPANGDNMTLLRLLTTTDRLQHTECRTRGLWGNLFWPTDCALRRSSRKSPRYKEHQANGIEADTRISGMGPTRRGARNWRPMVDRLVFCKNYWEEYADCEGIHRCKYGRLTTNRRTPGVQAVQYIFSVLKPPIFKIEQLWREGLAESVEETMIRGKLSAVRVNRYSYPGARSGPTMQMPKTTGNHQSSRADRC